MQSGVWGGKGGPSAATVDDRLGGVGHGEQSRRCRMIVSDEVSVLSFRNK